MPIIDYSSIHNLGKSPHTSRKKVSSSKSRTPSRSKSEAAELLASDLIPSHLHLGDFISNSDLDGPPSPSHSSTSSLILPKDPLPYTRALSPNNHARLHPPPASPSPPPRPLRNPERVNRVSTSATTSLSGKRVPFVHRKRTSIRSRADLISPPRYPPPTQPLPLPPQAPFDTPSSPPLVPSVPGDSLAVLPSNNQSLPPAPAPSSSGSSSETKTQGQQEQETGVGHSKIGAAIGPQPQAHSPPAVSFHLPTRTPTSTEMYNPPLLPLVPSNRSSPPSHKTESTGDQGQGEQTQANVGAGDSRPQQTRRPTHAFTSPFNSPLLPWSPHPSYPPTHPHSPSSQQGSTSTSNTRKQAPGQTRNSRGVGQTSIQIPARSKFKFKFPSLSPGYAPYSLPPSLPLSQIPRRVSQSQSHPQPHPASAPSYISNYSRTQPNSDSIDANDKYNTTDRKISLSFCSRDPLKLRYGDVDLVLLFRLVE
ncbi:hypothetical protein BDN67DRAFT_966107 [Paxillus ammoniavirescens]|nr:hypothetical protein BDN67DRAFT_966107 [Paxillus ammoniavirescens]